MINNTNTAIQKLTKIDGFEKVIINECSEPLVKLTETNKLKIANIYFKNQYNFSLSTCYVRKRVAEMLHTLADDLPENYVALIYDGWRPYKLQIEIFKRMYDSLKLRNPKFSDVELEIETTKYASKGSLNPLKPSPHFTGGSVDITLVNISQQELNMGTQFDASIKASETRYFEEILEQYGILSRSDKQALENRRVLFHAMIKQGFTNYSNEWWHYDYGNQLWGKIKNENAIYGIIEP